MSSLYLNDAVFLPLLFLVSVLTGLVGALGGSGGLVLVPFMISCGLPPVLSLGSARASAMIAWVVATKKFASEKLIHWKTLYILAPVAILAGSLGTYLIINLNQEHVTSIVGVILLLIAPLSLLKKDFGTQNKKKSTKSKTIGYVLYGLIMIYGGFFGGGTAILAMFTLVHFMGFKALEARAVELVAWILFSLFSTAQFLYAGQINFTYVPIIMIGMSLGSYTGARLAIKKGNVFVKYFVGAFAIIVGVKLLMF